MGEKNSQNHHKVVTWWLSKCISANFPRFMNKIVEGNIFIVKICKYSHTQKKINYYYTLWCDGHSFLTFSWCFFCNKPNLACSIFFRSTMWMICHSYFFCWCKTLNWFWRSRQSIQWITHFQHLGLQWQSCLFAPNGSRDAAFYQT